MITNVTRREDDRISWNDIEALPIYGAAAILAVLLVRGLHDAGPMLHADALKSAVIVGMLGLRAWAGMGDDASV